jgi:hypothetical protein
MDKKVGETIRQLPIDPKQEVSKDELEVLRDMFQSSKPSKSSKVKIKEVKEDESDDDSDTDSDKEDENYNSDEEEDVQLSHKSSDSISVMSEIKSTFLASILFVLLNTEIVDTTIKNMGIDGFKLTFVKLFLFATIFFILRYKFL